MLVTAIHADPCFPLAETGEYGPHAVTCGPSIIYNESEENPDRRFRILSGTATAPYTRSDL